MEINFGVKSRLPRRLTNSFGFLIFALAFIAVIVIGSLLLNQRAGKTFAETEGVIVDITREYYGDEYHYSVFVDYTVDGREYNNVEYNQYNSGMDIGDTVKINYNVEDPVDIEAPSTATVFIIMIAAGVIGALFFIWKAFRTFIR